MPRETKATTIDGVKFQVTELGADTADEMIFRLGRGLALSDFSTADFAWAKARLIETVKVGVVDEAGGGKVNLVPLASIYDDEFAGPTKRATAGKLLKFAWEVNFGDFFGGLRSLMSARKDLSSSISPKDAAGASGASSSTPG